MQLLPLGREFTSTHELHDSYMIAAGGGGCRCHRSSWRRPGFHGYHNRSYYLLLTPAFYVIVSYR